MKRKVGSDDDGESHSAVGYRFCEERRIKESRKISVWLLTLNLL